MSSDSRDPGRLFVRAALVLILVSSSVRYFGDSPRTDTTATWLYWLAVAAGLVGIAVLLVSRRRAAPPPQEDRPDAG